MAKTEGWKLVVTNKAGKVLLVRRNLPKEVAMLRVERAIAVGHEAKASPELRRRTRQRGYVNSHPTSRRRAA